MPTESTEMLVFLVRHTEPAGPAGKRFLGHANPPLSPTGREQARLLATALSVSLAKTSASGSFLQAAHSSDLRRCLETAELVVCGTGITVIPHTWLREIDVGLWEGLTWDEARRQYPTEYAQRELDLIGYPFPGGESFRDLEKRVVPLFLVLIDREWAAGHRRVLVVAHKSVNRVLLAHFGGLPLDRLFSIPQDFAAINVLKISAGPTGMLQVLAERPT